MNIFLEKAEKHKPKLKMKVVKDYDVIKITQDNHAYQGFSTHFVEYTISCERQYKKQDRFVLDFKEHIVGYFSFKINNLHGAADSPLRIRLLFAEVPSEIGLYDESYKGSLSESWIQEELITVSEIPGCVTIQNRYAFRYVLVEVIAVSENFAVGFSDFSVLTVTSAADDIEPIPTEMDAKLKQIDLVGMRTLKNCMQTVFEDGPKRDRRLWIGDLRLQALVNYKTFKNYDLVKRCLYLFAGLAKETLIIPAAVYEKPTPLSGNDYLMDYSMAFVAGVYDYFQETGDKDFLEELWETVKNQIEYSLAHLDENYIVKKQSGWWCFIDWCEGLDRITSLQGITIWGIRLGIEISKVLGESTYSIKWKNAVADMKQAALNRLYDVDEEVFYGDENNKQLSWASQIWMILARVIDKKTGAKLIQKMFSEKKNFICPGTPYLYHYAIEAMVSVDEMDIARETLLSYWGAMVEKNADTFWEVFDLNNDMISPYSDVRINSYCHAWSCTPSYFIRSGLFNKFEYIEEGEHI